MQSGTSTVWMIRSALLSVLGLIVPFAAFADLALVMVEQPGCVYCKAWNTEISAIYPLTDEGKAAPLTRVQLRAPLPEDMQFARPAVFTPTFVLLNEGVEVSRIEGYPGEAFFWGLLGQMIDAEKAAPGN